MGRPKWTEEDLLERSSINSKGRATVWYRGKICPRSHLLWNLRHPDDPVRKGEIVHHKDRDPLNDADRNHQKMPKTAHDLLHTPERVTAAVAVNTGRSCPQHVKDAVSLACRWVPLPIEHKTKLSIAHQGKTAFGTTKKAMSKSQRRRRSSEMKWSPEEALRLRALGLSKKVTAARLGVWPFTVTDYFKRRGLAW